MVGRHPLGSLFDLISIISVFLALLFAWLFSVWENDEVDIDIDKISNQNRPLAVEETLSKEEWRDLKYIFLAYSLSFAFLSGFYTFIFTALLIFAWFKPKIGGILYTLAGIGTIIVFNTYRELFTFLVISLIPVIIGALFWFSKKK